MSESTHDKTVLWQKYFLFAALGASIIGALLASKTLFSIDKKIVAAKDAARPATISVIRITVPSCADCFSVDEAVANLKKQHIVVSEERALAFDSPEAQTLIQKFGIKRVPAYVATGEIKKQNLENFFKDNGAIKDGTFIFEKVTPVFIDPISKQKLGLVRVTHLTDPSCQACPKPQVLMQSLNQAGVRVSASTTVAWNSSVGQKIISQYNIKSVPTIIISSDLGYYDEIKTAWPQKIGTIESDGTYVVRQLPFPYRDVQKNKIVGLVDIVYLVDSSCKNCYKPNLIHKSILTQGFGVAIGSEKTVDAATVAGKELVKKYNLTQIPTVLISPDIVMYTQITSLWPKVGTVEQNGWYVFRKMEQIGDVTYKDLSTNKIIKPTGTPDSQ